MGSGFVFVPLAVGFLLLEGLGLLAMVLTGSWSENFPPIFRTLNPLFTYVDGLRHPIVPDSVFRSLSNGYAINIAANLYVYSILQYMGLAFLLDFAKNKMK